MNLTHTAAIALTAALASATGIRAEDIDTEIKIEREVVPEERAAARLHLLPTLSLPPVTASRLTPNYRTEAITPATYLTLLDPAAFGATAPADDQLGYIDLGYGPAYNLTASAGYRFLRTESTDARAWLQFNGAKYHRSGLSLHRNTGLVAAEAAHRFASPEGGTLKAHADLGFGSWNNPVANPDKNISDLRADIDLGWNAGTGSVSYGADAAYRLTSLGGIDGALAENIADIAARFDWHYNTVSTWGIGASWLHASLNENTGSKDIVRINPRYRFTKRRFSATVGAEISGLSGSMTDGSKWLFTPEADIAWMPSGSFTLWTRFGAGHVANTLSEMLDYTLYIDPRQGFAPAKCNADWQLGVTIGPWRGAAIQAYFHFNSTDGALLPGIDGGFYAHDTRGILFGIRADYSWRSYLALHVTFEHVPTGGNSDDPNLFAPWRDAATCRFDAAADIRPVDPLTVTVGYEVRTGRHAYSFNTTDGPAGASAGLGTFSNLHARVNYSIDRSWSVWLEGENLLGKRYLTIPGIPAQGARGMAGVSYKFH